MQANLFPRAHFTMGRLLMTPGALHAFAQVNGSPLAYLERHAAGDWGACCPEDAAANTEALANGRRLFSVYFLPDETKIWVITEAADDVGHRAATTILLPEEY